MECHHILITKSQHSSCFNGKIAFGRRSCPWVIYKINHIRKAKPIYWNANSKGLNCSCNIFFFYWTCFTRDIQVVNFRGKGIYLKSRYPCDYTCSSDFTSPGSGRTAACNYWSNLGSVHQVPITAGWTEAVWNTKFARHFYTWPTLGIEPQTFWSWVQFPISTWPHAPTGLQQITSDIMMTPVLINVLATEDRRGAFSHSMVNNVLSKLWLWTLHGAKCRLCWALQRKFSDMVYNVLRTQNTKYPIYNHRDPRSDRETPGSTSVIVFSWATKSQL